MLISGLLCCFMPVILHGQSSFQKLIDFPAQSGVYCQPTGDGGIMVVTSTVGFTDNDFQKVSFTRFDKDGNIRWSKLSYYSGDFTVSSFITADNGDYIVC